MMNLSNRIDRIKAQIDREIDAYFKGRKPGDLYEPMRYLLDAGGKRIRPLLVILSCEAMTGREEDCFFAALGVEILHTFTLVHDDIMDHDKKRRGRPTVHTKWDESTAILAGDGLVTMAYQTILKTVHPHLVDVLNRFTDGLMVLCEGQALDKSFECRTDVTLDEYEEMIGKKTAKLIEVSCEIGAILGNGSPEEVDAVTQYAFFLGKGFQIQDDLLDIQADESVSGKSRGSDLLRKKKTFLTIYLLSHAPAQVRKQFLQIWQKDSVQKEDVNQLRDLLIRGGAFHSAQEKIDSYFEEALNALNALRESDAKEDLISLVLQLKNRNK